MVPGVVLTVVVQVKLPPVPVGTVQPVAVAYLPLAGVRVTYTVPPGLITMPPDVENT